MHKFQLAVFPLICKWVELKSFDVDCDSALPLHLKVVLWKITLLIVTALYACTHILEWTYLAVKESFTHWDSKAVLPKLTFTDK